jgi:hypothetical protein
MKVNVQSFFTFCAAHVPLLRALAGRGGELSESDVIRLIRQHADPEKEMPETTWRRLREYLILVPSEPGGDSYLLVEPVGRLLSYLLNEANPATPEIIRGHVESLDALGKQLSKAIAEDNVTVVGLAFHEISVTLRRIHTNLEETQQAVLAEVGRYKTERLRVSVREKFRRIVFWMERYVEPLIEIVRPDGPLRATFDEIERLLRGAREQVLFNDHPALERNLRFLRLVQAHALRVFQQCRKEIQPLYDSLRRSSLIAEGAARALDRLQNEGVANWGSAPLISICYLRVQNVPGDGAIKQALQRVFTHPPEPPPILEFTSEDPEPAEFLRRVWLDSLSDTVAGEAPIPDLLAWLLERYPEQDTAAMLAGLSTLVFDRQFDAAFTEESPRPYQTRNGFISAAPVQIKLSGNSSRLSLGMRQVGVNSED